MHFPHRVTLIEPARGDNDAHGNAIFDYESEEATRIDDAPAWVQHRSAREQHEPGRSAAVSEWTLVLPLSFAPVPTEEEPEPDRIDLTVIGPRARVLHAEKTFEIEGDPKQPGTPRGAHHIEATLQVVTG